MSFAARLAELIGEESVSGFARRVDLSEALIRKYLKGSEPGLMKANQIAMRANCSLEFLATGCGYLYRQAEVVDAEALKLSYEEIMNEEITSTKLKKMVSTVAGYQYLRTHKRPDGYLDKEGMRQFLSLARQITPE